MAARHGSPPRLESVFQPGSIILDFKDHAYNPCNDLIFPSVIKARGCLAQPQDAYYMYYAPHDPPGGICMAHAPSIEGPWKEYKANPLISKDWPPHYKLGHVSSPHALWIAEECRLFVYFHGDNDQTQYAVSKDGLSFDYGGVALNQTAYADYREGVYDRVFYGRVFEHRIPSKNNRYVFLFARSCGAPPNAEGRSRNGIYLSWSDDARKWSTPVRIVTTGEGMSFVCSPCLFSLRGKHYVAYHADFKGYTDTYVIECDAEFAVRRPLGRLFDHRQYGETNPRVSDPLIYIEGDMAYLVNAIGKVFNQRFALAKAKVMDLARALAAQA
jgi:hypothetical protein